MAASISTRTRSRRPAHRASRSLIRRRRRPADNAPPTPIDGGSYDGSGLHNTGVVQSFPPQLYTYSLAFTTPGSYEYVCLIHPDMKGTINVT